MQQWEYCALFGANKSERELAPKWPSLVYFTKMGMETVNLATKVKDERPPEWQEASEADYVAHTIAALGLDGWELVSVSTTPLAPATARKPRDRWPSTFAGQWATWRTRSGSSSAIHYSAGHSLL